VEQPLDILMITHHRRFKANARSSSMATSLVRRGHSVTLVSTSNDRRFGTEVSASNGVRVVEVPDLLWGRLRSGWDMWDLLKRIAFLRKDDSPYDLVHCFETRPTTIYPALDLVRRRKLPFVTDWNDWFGRGGLIAISRPRWYRAVFGGIETYFEEGFRTRAAGLTVISTALARRAAALGVPEDRICHIPGGVVAAETPWRSIDACRVRMRYPSDAPILGYASADTHFDIEIVVKALRLVVATYPDTKLVISGRASKPVVDLVTSYGVQDNVVFTGFVSSDDLAWHMGAADVFLLPFPDTVYNRGRWPNKIGLYMCLGRPTVTNPSGDLKPLFDRHRVGLLAECDPEDFAAKILMLLESPKLASELGTNARRVALTEHNWDKLVLRLEDFYREVLAR
jgi:glycosyltransferase involved in cell wall biosynthesis